MSTKLRFSARETDRGLDRLRLTIEQLSHKPVVKVGVIGEAANVRIKRPPTPGSPEGADAGIAMAELVAVHEYGSPKRGIPERSFIRSTLERKRWQIVPELRKGLVGILSGTTTGLQVLTVLGEKMALEIQKTIDRGLSPPLKDGSGFKPLIKTGQLILSISSEVELDGRNLK